MGLAQQLAEGKCLSELGSIQTHRPWVKTDKVKEVIQEGTGTGLCHILMTSSVETVKVLSTGERNQFPQPIMLDFFWVFFVSKT